MKKQLAWISENGNRHPLNDESRKFVRISELQHPKSDDWKRGQSDAFNHLWPIYCRLEAQAIAQGLIDAPIQLAPDEEDAIPF
ncbi:hypothetical protein [Yoonia sp. I 8.24]|uniref:hypothetical protein n=1 Tax=Yoonia sp. I 8.24 TaxID=1537229 RepID=UPI001EE10C28|nr:hypothetical protein [Yoonia sp. I 8.24]MCG3267163.1 hypothetical protein [Yoonia sp. I 8.24]